MKRFALFILAALIAALAIWYGLRVAEKTATVAVTSLLPKETLMFAHVPDLNAARAQWRQTDIYQLWREPAVQDFLHKPLGRIPRNSMHTPDLASLERLEPRDLFFAVTAWDMNGPKAVAGFRFKGSADEAEKAVSPWRAKLERKFPQAQHETVVYQQHPVQLATAVRQTLATAYDGQWFFAANDLAELKAMLDRADHRAGDQTTTLASEEVFAAAFKHMPRKYATLLYGRFDRALEKLAPLLPAVGSPAAGPAPTYRRLHAVCGTLAFDGGKIRDVLFLGMPKLVDAELTRASLSLGTKDTFLYLASFLNIAPQSPSSSPGMNALPAILQNLAGAVSSTKLTAAEWNAAFGPELGVVGDWPASARLPSLLASVPVIDAAKAKQALAKFLASNGNTSWTQQAKEGVSYYSSPSVGQLFPFAPTLALSDHLLVAGSNAAAVEAVMPRSAGHSSGLTSVANFESAERAVPAAHQAFFYIDAALLYTRLDTALRPLLMMGAAFMPSLSENIDLSKWPDTETVTKHLSPIVMSQNYQSDGYVTESIGPVTLYQAALGLGILGAGGASFYQHQTHAAGAGGWSNPVSPLAPATPAASPSPSPDTTP